MKINRLQKGFHYYANYVSYPQDKYTAFQVGVKQEDGSYHNYRFFCFDRYDWLQDGTRFKLDDIVSVLQNEYNGKQQFQVTADISMADVEESQSGYVQDKEPSVEEEFGGNTLDIQADDLPF